MSDGDRSHRGRRDFVGKIRNVNYGCHSGFNEEGFRRSGYFDGYNNRSEKRIPSLLGDFPTRIPCYNPYPQPESHGIGRLPRPQPLLPTPNEPNINVFSHIASRESQLAIASNIISRLLTQPHLAQPVEPQRRTLLPEPLISSNVKYKSSTVKHPNSYKELQPRSTSKIPRLDQIDLSKGFSSQQENKEETIDFLAPQIPKNFSPPVVQKSPEINQTSYYSEESSSSNVDEATSHFSAPRSPDNPCSSAEVEDSLGRVQEEVLEPLIVELIEPVKVEPVNVDTSSFVEEHIMDESTTELSEEAKSSALVEQLPDALFCSPTPRIVEVVEREKTPYDDISNKYLYCHICVRRMKDSLSFTNHIQSRNHQMLLESFVENYKIRTELLRHNAQIEEQRRNLHFESMKRLGKANNIHHEYCPMCDVRFYGNLILHRKSAHHQKLKRFLHPNCVVCDKEFSNRIDRDYHRLSVEHLKALETMEQKILYSESDDEDNQTSEILMEDKPLKVEGSKKDGPFSILFAGHHSDEVVGYSAVKRITAFYCRICRKYFSKQGQIFDNHCKSREHHEKYSKMVGAITEDMDDNVDDLESVECELLDSVVEESS